MRKGRPNAKQRRAQQRLLAAAFQAGQRASAPKPLDTRSDTTRGQVVVLHKHWTARSREVLLEKNRDYGSASDALANFRGAATADVSAPQAVFSRLNDKIHRLGRAAAGRLKRRDDDVLDALNLLVLLDAALRERKPRP